ncbi:hypothetical protein [Mesorhizobium sp. B2-8-3]|uniref:hypothetical protein n=1 Tax=Mesorhizobium sp. B2-8-3 TaxID=2589905 RepID=UPI00112B4552|nr:hypothetical protein [Mesorhizobium sp. B2-8-3]TPJ33703.1 hypothetical protein FJ418_13825 [Mesorhizobium sp. B2-8-3]
MRTPPITEEEFLTALADCSEGGPLFHVDPDDMGAFLHAQVNLTQLVTALNNLTFEKETLRRVDEQ